MGHAAGLRAGTRVCSIPVSFLVNPYLRPPSFYRLLCGSLLTIASLQYAFSRQFKKKGMIKLSTYLRQYKYVLQP